MSWYPSIANTGFCETLRLRKRILERQRLPRSTRPPVLEPASAEFLSALAAGSNSRHILQIGCGLSTIALAAAAKATGTCLISVNSDRSQQDIVQRHIKELELEDYVEFHCEEPLHFVPTRENVDFVFLTGDAGAYTQLFDLLKLKSGAIVVADNALYDSTNEYIKHVRKQPGVDSSTLFVGRGIEITKIVSWEQFRAGRKRYTGQIVSSDGRESLLGSDILQQPLPNASSSNAHIYSSIDSNNLGLAHSKSEAVLAHRNAQDKEEAERTSTIATQTMLSTLADLQGSNLADLVIQATSQISPEAIAGLESDETAVAIPIPTSNTLTNVVMTPLKVIDHGPVHVENQVEQASTSRSEVNLVSVDTLAYPESTAPSPLKSTPQIVSSQKPLSTVVESKPSFQVHFKNENGQTEITIEGEDQDMLLTDITLAFSEAGVSVRRAKIATQDKYIEDIFYVVDAETQAPLKASQHDVFQEKLVKRIADRKRLSSDS